MFFAFSETETACNITITKSEAQLDAQLAQQRNGYCQQTPKTGIAEADLPVKVELHVGIIPYGTAESDVDDPPEQNSTAVAKTVPAIHFGGKRHGT